MIGRAKAKPSFQTEIHKAFQALRDENAELRRRVKVLEANHVAVPREHEGHSANKDRHSSSANEDRHSSRPQVRLGERVCQTNPFSNKLSRRGLLRVAGTTAVAAVGVVATEGLVGNPFALARESAR